VTFGLSRWRNHPPAARPGVIHPGTASRKTNELVNETIHVEEVEIPAAKEVAATTITANETKDRPLLPRRK
jgi:hypothetical protein